MCLRLSISALVLFAAFFVRIGSVSAQEPLVFIVNADNPVQSLSVSDLRDYFFKRKRTWPDGTSVRFIDRATASPLRQEFLQSYLKRKPDDVDMFWIGQKLYSGDSAPLQESSESMTIRFVESFKGAIGYVAASTDLTDRKVKVVQIER